MTEHHDPAITAYRLDRLEESQHSIAQSLQALVRLEQHHSDTRQGLERAWKELTSVRERVQSVDDQIPENLGARLKTIEDAMPTLKLTSGWVVSFTLGVFALAGLLVWNFVTDRHEHPQMTNERRLSIEADKPQ